MIELVAAVVLGGLIVAWLLKPRARKGNAKTQAYAVGNAERFYADLGSDLDLSAERVIYALRYYQREEWEDAKESCDLAFEHIESAYRVLNSQRESAARNNCLGASGTLAAADLKGRIRNGRSFDTFRDDIRPLLKDAVEIARNRAVTAHELMAKGIVPTNLIIGEQEACDLLYHATVAIEAKIKFILNEVEFQIEEAMASEGEDK